MNIRKTENLGTVVVIASAALILIACISGRRDHTERPAPRRTEKPPPSARLDRRIHVRHIVRKILFTFNFALRCWIVIELKFRKPDILSNTVKNFQPDPANYPRLKNNRLRCPVVWINGLKQS
jgi:hypothetical protein